jgi:hypothetical protein
MKKIIFPVILFIMILISLQAEESTLELKQVWACDPILETPESVIYDPVDSLIYVSNIVGDPLAVDGNGYISRLSKEGEVLQLKWITGLNAPKGMGIHNRILYVTDLTEIVEIDLTDKKILNRYTAPDAKLLNDIVVDKEGYIYISETTRNNDTIYKFRDGSFEKWHKSSNIERPNGLFIDGDFLVVGSSGNKSIVKLNLTDGKLIDSIKVDNLTDGLTKIAPGSFIFSNWYGKIFHLKDFKQVEELIDLIPLRQNAADLFYSEHLQLLLVPTFFNDRIIAFQILKK